MRLFLLLLTATACAAEPPTLHPRATALPFTQQGPFITTADGGVLCIDAENALRMKIHTADLGAGAAPVFVPPPKPESKPGGIVMFGDSTTAPRGSLKVYATRVAAALQSSGSSLSVHNAGIGGNTTRDALKRLQSDVLQYKPRLVVMQFGINDSAVDVWKTPPATTPRVPLAEYLSNLRLMISAAQKQGAKVILMTTNPLRWTPKLKDVYGKPPYQADAEDGFDAATLAGYNAALRQLAAELKVPLVDVRAAYPKFAAQHRTTIGGLLLDGMHPNDLGQQLVAELLVPAIRDAVK